MHTERKKNSQRKQEQNRTKRTASFAFGSESERERQRGERIEHKNNLVLGGKVHRTKETFEEVCRHFVAFFSSYIRRRRIHAILFTFNEDQSLVACFIIKVIAKIFIYLCLICTIYVCMSCELLKSKTITSGKQEKNNHFKYDRMNRKKNHFIYTILDDKTIHSLQGMCRTEKEKKSCEFQQKKIKYGRQTENRLHYFYKIQ